MRLISMRAVKVVAAATVICAAALSACTAGQRSPARVPAGVSQPRPGGMPGYYAVMAGRDVIVRAAGDGHVTGSVALPVPAGTPRTPVDDQLFGSADGRHVVIVVSRGGHLPGVAAVALFQLTVSPGGRPGGLRQIGLDNRGMPVTGAALSPDGKMLALSLVHEFPPGPLYGSIEVINLARGTTRAWTGQSAPGYWPGTPGWASDRTVVLPWWHSASPGTIPAQVTGIRHLDTAAPGRSLAAAPLIAFLAPVPGLQTAAIAPGGGQIIASSCRAGHHTATARVLELSATDGRLVRVLRTQTARYPNDTDAQDAALSMCQVLSVAGDGHHLLVQAFAFGRIDNGVFTSLPGTTPRVLPVSAAW